MKVSSKLMGESTEREWPVIDSDYADEFGQVQAEIYLAAGAVWDSAKKFALLTLQDPQAGSRLLFKAAVIVSLKQKNAGAHIDDLKAYLFQTYKHLVLDELRKENRRKEIQTERRAELESLSVNVAEDIDRKILLEQVMRRMDPWLRKVFQWRCLDYDFHAIAKALGEKTGVVRSKYSKRVTRLLEKIEGESRRAAEKASERK